MSIRNITMFTVGTAVALLLIDQANAQEPSGGPYEINRSTIDGGGVMHSTGGNFELSGTIGQCDAGEMIGGTYALTGGFWFGTPPGDCDADGNVTLFDYAELATCLDGPGAGLNDPACGCFDFDANLDIDLLDFAVFQLALTGPGAD